VFACTNGKFSVLPSLSRLQLPLTTSPFGPVTAISASNACAEASAALKRRVSAVRESLLRELAESRAKLVAAGAGAAEAAVPGAPCSVGGWPSWPRPQATSNRPDNRTGHTRAKRANDRAYMVVSP